MSTSCDKIDYIPDCVTRFRKDDTYSRFWFNRAVNLATVMFILFSLITASFFHHVFESRVFGALQFFFFLLLQVKLAFIVIIIVQLQTRALDDFWKQAKCYGSNDACYFTINYRIDNSVATCFLTIFYRVHL